MFFFFISSSQHLEDKDFEVEVSLRMCSQKVRTRKNLKDEATQGGLEDSQTASPGKEINDSFSMAEFLSMSCS